MLTVYRDFASAEGVWRGFQARAAGHPFQHFDWLHNWHRTIGATSGYEPFIVVVEDDQSCPLMLLPLCIERQHGFKRLVSMGDPICDYHGALVDPARVAELVPARIEQLADEIIALAGVDYLLMTRMPPKLGAVDNPLLALCPHAFSSDAHATTLGPDWDAFYAERRSTKTRRRFREKEKALGKAGEICFDEVTAPAERQRLVAQMMQLKAEQLVASAGSFNTFSDPEVQRFFTVAAGDESISNMRVFTLTVGDKLAAAVIGIVCDTTFYYQVPVYPANELQRHSPGNLLLHRLMTWAIERGYSRFDFTIGDEGYKADWCDETWHLRCGTRGTSVMGMIGGAVARTEIDLKRRVKQNPRVMAQAVKLRTMLGRVRAWAS